MLIRLYHHSGTPCCQGCCQGCNEGPYRQEQVQAHLPADAFHIQLWMPLLLRELVLALLQNSQVVMSISFDLRAALIIIFHPHTFGRPELAPSGRKSRQTMNILQSNIPDPTSPQSRRSPCRKSQSLFCRVQQYGAKAPLTGTLHANP